MNQSEIFLETVDHQLTCAITSVRFNYPVMTADGHTYERSAIRQWIKRNRTSPVTNLRLANAKLIQNIALRNILTVFVQSEAEIRRLIQSDKLVNKMRTDLQQNDVKIKLMEQKIKQNDLRVIDMQKQVERKNQSIKQLKRDVQRLNEFIGNVLDEKQKLQKEKIAKDKQNHNKENNRLSQQLPIKTSNNLKVTKQQINNGQKASFGSIFGKQNKIQRVTMPAGTNTFATKTTSKIKPTQPSVSSIIEKKPTVNIFNQTSSLGNSSSFSFSMNGVQSNVSIQNISFSSFNKPLPNRWQLKPCIQYLNQQRIKPLSTGAVQNYHKDFKGNITAVFHNQKFINLQQFFSYDWSSLEQLSLNDCGISNEGWRMIVKNAGRLQKLQNIYIKNNHINEVRPGDLQAFKSLKIIFFAGSRSTWSNRALLKSSEEYLEKYKIKNPKAMVVY